MRQPTFGWEGEKARFCSAHKVDGMLDVKVSPFILLMRFLLWYHMRQQQPVIIIMLLLLAAVVQCFSCRTMFQVLATQDATRYRVNNNEESNCIS